MAINAKCAVEVLRDNAPKPRRKECIEAGRALQAFKYRLIGESNTK